MHTKNLFHYELKSTTMLLTNNYKTLKLRNSDVREMGSNSDDCLKDDYLKDEVFQFGCLLIKVMTNGEFFDHLNDHQVQCALTHINDKYKNFNRITKLIKRCFAAKDQRPTMEEVLFILEIDHTTKLDFEKRV